MRAQGAGVEEGAGAGVARGRRGLGGGGAQLLRRGHGAVGGLDLQAHLLHHFKLLVHFVRGAVVGGRSAIARAAVKIRNINTQYLVLLAKLGI